VREAVESAVESAVFSEVESAVREAADSAPRRISVFWHYWLGGALWPWWPSYESFMREVCGLRLPDDLSERAAAYASTSENAGYWWPNRNFIMACERPVAIRRDTEGRLHNESGKSIEWPDGWGLHSWHGVTIPDEWIEKKGQLTPETAITWGNIEQRRAACEIIGWDNILDQLNARSIDRDADPMIGELVEVNIPDVGREKFLRVLCGTGRRFALPVPPTMQTALQANAWTFGMDEKTFIPPEIRT